MQCALLSISLRVCIQALTDDELKALMSDPTLYLSEKDWQALNAAMDWVQSPPGH